MGALPADSKSSMAACIWLAVGLGFMDLFVDEEFFVNNGEISHRATTTVQNDAGRGRDGVRHHFIPEPGEALPRARDDGHLATVAVDAVGVPVGPDDDVWRPLAIPDALGHLVLELDGERAGLQIGPLRGCDVVGGGKHLLDRELKLQSVPSVVPGGGVFDSAKLLAYSELVVARVRLRPLGEIDGCGGVRQAAQRGHSGQRLVGGVRGHHLKGFVVNAIHRVAIDNEFKWIAANHGPDPFLAGQPVMPQQFLKFILSDWISFDCYEVLGPETDCRSDMEVGKNHLQARF